MITLTLIDHQTHQILKEWQFTDQSPIRIGRFQDNDVMLTEYSQVSRHHAELHRLKNTLQWVLLNKGSNGTLVNGTLTPKTIIKDNDIIQLAEKGPILRFKLGKPTLVQKSTEVEASKGCEHAGNLSGNLFCIHCGEALVDKEEFVHEFQILRTLGRGGMGITYLAWDRQGKVKGKPTLLVLKQMNADMAQIPKARELFEREARILQGLKNSGIPKYYDFFVEDNKKYLAMELVHGKNLEQIVLKHGAQPIPTAIKWMVQACHILTYLHSLDPPLVHRDVKPANLMLRSVDRAIMLLDFGAVKEIGTPVGTRIGAEGYSAPEQMRGKPSPQSDIYAVGATLVFLITGHSPLQYYQRKSGGYYFNLSEVTGVSEKLAEIINKACNASLADRYKKAQDLAMALGESV